MNSLASANGIRQTEEKDRLACPTLRRVWFQRVSPRAAGLHYVRHGARQTFSFKGDPTRWQGPAEGGWPLDQNLSRSICSKKYSETQLGVKNTRNIYRPEDEARYFSTQNTKVLEYLYCGKSSGCKLLAVRRIFLRATLG